jgi:hypothetical protein
MWRRTTSERIALESVVLPRIDDPGGLMVSAHSPYAGNHGLDTTAPMSEWTKAGAYQSQQECRQAQQAFTTVMSQPRRAMERAPAQALLAIERSQCLSADDFRLEAGQPLPAP